MSAPPITHRFTDHAALGAYILAQVTACCPDASLDDARLINDAIPQAMERLRPILASAVAFQPGVFNHLHAMQHATFLYLLASEIWKRAGQNDTSERLFLLNRAHHSLDVYYKLQLPRVFLIAHGLGAVLANASYGNNFVFFQGATVGRLGDKAPVIGDNVILFSNSAVLGSAVIGANCVISAGAVVSNTTIPDDSIVFGSGPSQTVKRRSRDYQAIYFRAQP